MKFWIVGFSFLMISAAFAQGQSGAASPAAGTPLPIQITAKQGIEWRQSDQEVIATGSAQAVRGEVTVRADQLIAHYRKKATTAADPAATGPAKPAAASDPESVLNNGNSEIYEIEAVGNVHISTPTDNAYGDHAVYNMDNAVLVLTGTHLKLTTLHDVITARDAIEYYSVKREAIARGKALIVADDGRSITADTLIGYLAPPPPSGKPVPATTAKSNNTPDMLGQAGKLQKVDAIGHVVIHTPTQTATGDSGVYLPGPDMARLGGNVHIISGPNQLSGSDALVNMKTGVATLLAAPGGQVAGTVTPNSAPAINK
ncbi:MAG: organic solvent tolerance protein OstA [Acidocella sp. 20-57-95]|nr:MAG: organic solvent tolerance protein OstA [Acidocella sp. 20-57-95]OYV61199.1 MAG: organic solvent tolerance protein OstA [Acidocella sp. 21-58-7]HQT64696.1 LptA/OstA family protein [Acidocella sp.]HQU04985.1 LptA/OstA family protein [Acidocella sp.]